MNHQINRYYFGEAYKPAGFYPPEMAYSAKLGQLLAKLGFKWVIADEILTGRLGNLDCGALFEQKDTGLVVFLRNRRASDFVASAKAGNGRALVLGIKKRVLGCPFVVTALDGETFGHHNKLYERVLFEAYRLKRLKAVTLSELAAIITQRKPFEPKAASWSASEAEVRRGNAFALWQNPNNPIHRLQWRLTNLAISKVEMAGKADKGYNRARHFLDLGLHSDQYWWASGRIIFKTYLLWSVEMIEAGAQYLVQAVNSLQSIPKKDKEKAHQLYDRILETAFRWQREGVIARKRAMLSKKR